MRLRTFCLVSASAVTVVGLAAAPAAPRHHHSVSISGGHKQPAENCSDLRIRFDDRDAVVRSETRTLSKAAASGDAAESMLSQISMSVENGTVSTHGPSGEQRDWTVYLLIRTPKSAAIELETMNGPISLYDVDGKLTAHAHNGPIGIRNFSGDAEVTALNGPVSVEGSSGSVRIRTENGPINVNLKGTSWNGSGLSADAQNGPVTLRVPHGFQSGFVVESTNYAPMSCHASICESARKTWDDEHRRIEYGSSPVVHLSTVNGPVSVEEARE